MVDYESFLKNKSIIDQPSGFSVPRKKLNKKLFDFQKLIVEWSLKRGRAAIFADCGLGKTIMELEWAWQVCSMNAFPTVLILAPLAVAQQTVKEGEKFGYTPKLCEQQSDLESGINITNYEKMHRFDLSILTGIVLDESSILKSFNGKTRNQILDAFQRTPYKLACTATPAPNDYMELGNHAEFLGVMTRTEMLSTFFVHDGGDTSQWRLKRHAEEDFWKWLASWSVCIRKPSDLGMDDGNFLLPALSYKEHVVESVAPAGRLFAMEAQTLSERREARKASLPLRVEECAALVNKSNEPWVIWCDFNAEGDALEKLIPDAVQVAGSDTEQHKEEALSDFAEGWKRVLISKSSICGFGMNWQHCNNVAFVGLSDSFEQFYQAVRRCWRFGQTKDVTVHIFTSQAEGAVLKNIQRKEADAVRMSEGMVKHMKQYTAKEVKKLSNEKVEYKVSHTATSADWTAYLGDCVDHVRGMQSDSIDYSIFSPPFASLYTYSNSERDMGNSKSRNEFYEHFSYLAKELFRVLKPGRLLSFHCMNLPTSKQNDGVIGISDFRGDLIRLFIEHGFIYHSEVVIWKDPVTAMQRTKAIGLLHKQLKKDSAMSRQGIPDYLVTMRKPGINPDPVTHTNESFPVSLWQRYASPVWFDINPSDTLQKESARAQADEKHICPLQLEVIQRAIELWTNPMDLVLSPFMGIGSEGYVALQNKRRFIGIELKESYYKQAVLNLRAAEEIASQGSLFDLIPKQEFKPEYPAPDEESFCTEAESW